MKQKVELYGVSGTALIIPMKTGVYFTNQVGGHLCMQPQVEGVLIPIDIREGCDDVKRSLEYKLSTLDWGGWGPLSHKLADQIDSVLSDYSATQGISIDREKITSESSQVGSSNELVYNGNKKRKALCIYDALSLNIYY